MSAFSFEEISTFFAIAMTLSKNVSQPSMASRKGLPYENLIGNPPTPAQSNPRALPHKEAALRKLS